MGSQGRRLHPAVREVAGAGRVILGWAARWREDGGCFPALKAPELAPLTKRAASSIWGDSWNPIHWAVVSQTHLSHRPRCSLTCAALLDTPRYAWCAQSTAVWLRVFILALLEYHLRVMLLFDGVWSNLTLAVNGVSYFSLTAGESCASLVECRIPSATASIPSSALERQPVRSGDSSFSPLPPPTWSLQRKVNILL